MTSNCGRPFNWRAALITLPIVLLLLGLGTWQLQRLQWKEGLLAEIAAQQQQPALTMLQHEVADNLNYRRAELTGLLDRGAGYRLWPRTYEGRGGYHWLVPMVVATAAGPTAKPDGLLLLVNLGWLPDDAPPPSTAGSDVEVLTGTLRRPDPGNSFTPANPATGNTIYRVDLEEISADLGAPVFPYVLYADKIGNQPPLGGQITLSLPNNHRRYAITWFVLAGAVLVIYALATRRR